MEILKGLFGPSLNSVEKPSRINTDPSWLGLGSLYFVAEISKCFISHMAMPKYHQRALEACDVGEELLSVVELINDTKELVSHSKWTIEVYANTNSSDFTVKRTQAFSKIIFSLIDIFCNAVRVGFLLARVHVISLSSDLQKQLEKTNEVFYLFTQMFCLFQEAYQGHLSNALSHNSRDKKELDEKCRLSLLNVAEKSVKVSLAVLKKTSKKLDGPILALSACLLVLKISAHLYDSKVLSLHKGKFSLIANGFAYGCL
ncbi:MAG TPA: hypothetical protein VGZ69_00140 [Candidatus Rhabdochlamydia sp.]|jgi:hypothetical protein|nr:hypothetical protein [Candidatus Rhabdochlamydia sp.]